MSDDTRSQDYRVVFTNTFGMAFGPSEIELRCGIQKNPGTDDPAMEQQVGIVMTHQAAKLLAKMLNLFMEDFEEFTGQPVPLDPSKVAQLEGLIAAGKKARQAAS